MKVSERQDVISVEAAALAVQAAVRKAAELGCKVNAAIVDSGGNLVAFLRMPGAFLHSIEIAQDKAYTAASFGMPTGDFYKLIESDPALRDGLLERPRMTAFGGGHPIISDGMLLGGIGVSGASDDQDSQCALAGLAAIGLG
jgi:uncharacterized protein GlcG (DUF336 family)